MPTDAFGDKLLSKLKKLDPEQVQVYVARFRAQKQFMQEIFDHLDEGVVVADSRLRLMFANRRACLMLGWPRGKSYVGDDLGERLNASHPLHEVINSLRGRFRSVEGYECVYGPQEERILSLSTLPMRAQGFGDVDDEDSGDLLILLMHDVTERRKREAVQARAQRLASLATLTSGIAHEIKNPLNSLNIHAQLLQAEVAKSRDQGRRPDLERTERVSRVMLEETARLTRIVEDFIQAARPRTPSFKEDSIGTMLKRVEAIFAPECEKLGIEWQMHLDPELPPLLMDEHLIIQALRNLVRNAIDALTERARHAGEMGENYEPQLSLSAQLAGHFVTLIVEDNGHGIPEGSLEHIFEPYYTTKFGGSGLGLMVVYRIVTEHRGNLHVDTQPGQSTRFIISLPLDKRPVRLLDHQPDDQQMPVKVSGEGDPQTHHALKATAASPDTNKDVVPEAHLKLEKENPNA